MNYEEKVHWLRRYRDALQLEEELRQELEDQRSRACKTTAALTGMPAGWRRPDAAPRRGEHYRRAAGIAGTDQPLRGRPGVRSWR